MEKEGKVQDHSFHKNIKSDVNFSLSPHPVLQISMRISRAYRIKIKAHVRYIMSKDEGTNLSPC